MRATTPLVWGSVTSLAFLLAPGHANACSCRRPPPPQQAMDEAAAVFEGRTFNTQDIDPYKVAYEFEVTRFWKGDLTATVRLETRKSGASCGRSFREGVTYVVYASQTQDGLLRDSLCSRTREVEAASEDISVLGPGKTPGSEPAPVPDDTVPTEPPRIEPTLATDDPAGPPPAAPGPRGCSVSGDLGPRGPRALWLLAMVAIGRPRTVRCVSPGANQ